MKNTPRRRSLRNKRDRLSAQKVKIINPDDLEVSSPPKKSTRMERSTTSSKKVTRNREKLSNGSRLQQRNGTSAAMPPVITDVLKKRPEKEKKMLKDTQETQREELGPKAHSGYDERLSGKVSPGYTKLAMAIDEVSHSSVHNCSQPPCFRELGTNVKYEHVISFMYAFLIGNSHCTNPFLKRLVVFLREMMWIYGIAAAVNQKNLATGLVRI